MKFWRRVAIAGALVFIAAIVAVVAELHPRLPDIDLAGSAQDHPRAAARVAKVPPVGLRSPSALPGMLGSPLAPLPGVAPITGTVAVGGMVRTYELFAPMNATGKVPALVVLQGSRISLGIEESRDGLIQLAQAGKALVVYPVGYRESWNAGACCGPAHAAGVNDLSFVTGLVRAIGARPDVSTVFLVGYSNGGRMAFDAVCSTPRLVTSFVVVSAVPVVACPPGAPVSLLEMVGTADPILSYSDAAPHKVINGYTEPRVTDEVATWRRRNGCTAAVSTAKAGTLVLQTWAHCAGGSVVDLATYEGGGHAWPAGAAGTPSGAEVVWRFLTNSKGGLPPVSSPGGTSPGRLGVPHKAIPAATPLPS